MNQRDSSGLPLRAMVMVLVFLGVVFLLVGFQAMRSGSDDSSVSTAVTTTTTTTTTTATHAPPAPARPDVRVYNVSVVDGAAEATATRLRDAGWNVTETGNRGIELPVTTVYFSDAPGEREAADEVGTLLEAPVEPRLPEFVAEPPGVIVAVTG